MSLPSLRPLVHALQRAYPPSPRVDLATPLQQAADFQRVRDTGTPVYVAASSRIQHPAWLSQTMMPRRLNDPRDVVSIATQLGDPSNDSAPPIRVEHYRMKYLDTDGKLLKEELFSVGVPTTQDTVDVVFYQGQGNDTHLLVQERLRPLVAARAHWDGQHQETGVLLGLPATYLGFNSEGFDAAALRLSKVLDLQPAAPATRLGGSIMPSVGGSTERVYPISQQVPPLSLTGDKVSYGTGFEQMRAVRAVTPQSIVDGYLRGEVRDLRLVEGALRLARQQGSRVVCDLGVPKNKGDASDLVAMDFSQVMQRLAQARLHSGAVGSIEFERTAAPPNPFVDLHVVEARNVTRGGGTGASYLAWGNRRKHMDSVDIMAFSWDQQGRLVVPLKLGVRPSLQLREQSRHPVQHVSGIYNLEGPAGTLEHGSSDEAVLTTAAMELAEELDAAFVHPPRRIGFAYSSPGNSFEGVHCVAGQVTPKAHTGRTASLGEREGEVLWVAVDTVLALADAGVLSDGRASMHAALLKAHFEVDGASESIQRIHAHHQFAALTRLMNQGSMLERVMHEQGGDTHAALSTIKEYRSLLSYLENELGLALIKFEHGAEDHFFSCAVPAMSIPTQAVAAGEAFDPQKVLNAQRFAFYVLHDGRHFGTGEAVPISLNVDGSYRLMNQDVFDRCNAGNEAEVVWFSDCLIPALYGYDKVEAIFGGISLGRALAELGYPDLGMQRALVRKIELDGSIPKELLEHPAYQRPDVHGVVVGRLLRFHVMDRVSTQKIYQNWLANPEVATTAARFCLTFSNDQEYERYFSQSLERVRTYPEGINPLRAELARALNTEMRIPALQLAYLKQLVGRNRMPEPIRLAKVAEIQSVIDQLHTAYQRASECRNQTTTVEISQRNLDNYAILQKLRQEVIKPALTYLEALKIDHHVLEPEQIASLRGRVFPFFKDINFDATFDVPSYLKWFEAQCYSSAGLPVPERLIAFQTKQPHW